METIKWLTLRYIGDRQRKVDLCVCVCVCVSVHAHACHEGNGTQHKDKKLRVHLLENTYSYRAH